MPRKVIDVFLSSTAEDLTEHRKAVHDRLMRHGIFYCIWQEDFGAQDLGAVEFCRKKAREADMFVGLIGFRRGWEPDGDEDKRSITEMEHDWARDAGCSRYLWVAPNAFTAPDSLRESDELHARQMAFRKRVMGGGGRIVSNKGFSLPELLASEVVEQLLVQVATTNLLELFQPEAAQKSFAAIAAAVKYLVNNKELDLLDLVNDAQSIHVADLRAKLLILESKTDYTAKKHAEYCRHIGALEFHINPEKSLSAYEEATRLDPENPEGWRYLGELHLKIGDLKAAKKHFAQLNSVGERTGNQKAIAYSMVRLGWIELMLDNLTEAEVFAKKAFQLSRSIGWFEGESQACSALGRINRERSNHLNAERMFLTALELEKELGRKKGMAIAYACAMEMRVLNREL